MTIPIVTVCVVITFSTDWASTGYNYESCLWSAQQVHKKNSPLSPLASEKLVSRDGFGRPIPRQPTARLFLLFSFPCSADHERDWPPCKVFFFGLATNALNVRNNNNNNNNNALPCVMVYYVVSVLFLMFFWCPSMASNANVQYNGGLLPDIILLTQCYFHRGTRLNAMKRFCICSL